MANVPSETQLLSIKLMVCTKFPYNQSNIFHVYLGSHYI